MGTWTLFSPEYCANKSSCVLVDAWLQLALCLAAVAVISALCGLLTGCCRCLRCRRPTDNDDSGSEGSMIRRVFGRTRMLDSPGRQLGGRLRNKTSPLPVSVITKDAHSAHILSHKNSHKHGAHFIKQTQRMSRMDVVRKSIPGKTSDLGSDASTSSKEKAERSCGGPSRAEMLGIDGPRGLSQKRPRGHKSSFFAPAATRRASGEDGAAGLERSSSFRKRLMTVFTAPDFMSKRRSNPQIVHENGAHMSFDGPSYEVKHGLAELSPTDRLQNERRSSMELREKRRVSVGSSSQLQFQIGRDKASVYEVKLQEIQLVKRLASGPLSEVYAALWRDTKVGVKLLIPREGAVDHLAEAVKNFRREIWIMGALKHRNVLKLLGASLTPSCYVLMMEYMPNGSLYEYLRDAANFFPARMSPLHGPYTFVGTPFWAAPEVIRHEAYDEKADVYSFAIVLWELVERRDPYDGRNAYQVPLLVAHDGLRPAEFTQPAPLGLDQLMKQCWDADPEQRPTFEELAETLHTWLRPSESAEDLSAHVRREQIAATEEERSCFASSHDVSEKAIPIRLSSRRQSTRALFRKPSLHKTASNRSLSASHSVTPDTQDKSASI
ncbi:hypothetical protein PybrP1_005064 [[Pythium] brassicae (nom. inval.)]|nr:hypothetical protein PybrP1_005064 [[Pythium] brassicae (nom. inval.)]